MLPSVSFIIVGRNCASVLSCCMLPIIQQDYPKDLCEILFIDGDSIDNTKDIAQSFGAKVIDGGYPENCEARRFVGVQAACNDLLVFIDTDNIIPHKNWLDQMVQPFIQYSDLVGAFTKWYGFDNTTSSLDQYYALIGGNDPVVFYLGKNDRVPYLEKSLPCGAQLINAHDNFELVAFNNSACLPVVGCNGFLLRRSVINDLKYDRHEQYFHIDINVDIIDQLQRHLYAIVNTTIIHLTGDTVLKNIRKRLNYMNVHYVALQHERRYKVFDVQNSKDMLNLILCIIYAVTFIEPLLRSYKGWRRTGNFNWFYHPIMTFLLTGAYGVNVMLQRIKECK